MRTIILVVFGLVTAQSHALSPECSLGVRAAKEARHSDAIDLYSKCLEKDGLVVADRARALRNRANAYSQIRAFEKALIDQRAAIELETPKTVWPYVMLSMFLRETKNFDGALDALEKAIGLDEDGPGSGPGMAVSYHRGQALHRLGRYSEAIAAYSKGLEKQSDYAYAYYRRGLANEALGNILDAERDMRSAANFEPKDGFEADVALKLHSYKIDARKTRAAKLDP
jgi:tetratricopeptide (TPR) repeat protein